ncbi:helix-turn-helix protein [Buttiauxella sp. JUb87]|nr:helix-turn-helix protein [Buttiauxella sp. JUb87]
MKQRSRIYYTPEQKAIIWDRHKQGDSLHEIARMFDRYHSSIMPTIYQTGRYRPPTRKRNRLSLSLDEREDISRGLVAKHSIREIADKLSRAPRLLAARYRGMEAQINTVQQKLIRKRGTVPSDLNLVS